MPSDLWPHQAAGLDMLRAALRDGYRRPLLSSPTGSGKTILAGAIIAGALRKGNRVLFTVPALSLVDQTVAALEDEGISTHDVGVMQASHERTNGACPVQVASVQTLQNRQMPEHDIAIVDECHKVFEFYKGWFASSGKPIVGLSATPWTRGLGKLYDKLLSPTTTAALIEAGVLSPFKVFAPAHPDLTGVRTVAGDYEKRDLSKAMNKATLVADVVETWLRRAENRPTLVFAVDRSHAKHLETKFKEAGVAAAYMDAYTPLVERDRIRDGFHDGTIRVVCNCQVLTTGVDWDVRALVLARPTKSEMLFAQMVGRGLRRAEGKDHLILLDHSDTHLRLGFVTDIHHDTLDDGSPRAKAEPKNGEVLPKACPQCTFLKPAKVSICPSCGFKPQRISAVEVGDGELVELFGKGKGADKETKQRWFSMLRGVALMRGYKPGWAANQYRQKFGVWPRGLSERNLPPDAEVEGYVRHSLIRYAKQREGGDAR